MDYPATNPYPFIYAAYGISLFFILSYTGWLFWNERKLQRLSTLLKENHHTGEINEK